MVKNTEAKRLKDQLDLLDEYPSDDAFAEQGTSRARENILLEVFTLYNPFIHNMVYKYCRTNPGMFDDLLQSARIAFLTSFEKWDPEKSSLTTWASKEMRKALIKEALFMERPSLKRWNYEAMREVRRYREKYPYATATEVADNTGISMDMLKLIDTTHTHEESRNLTLMVSTQDTAETAIEEITKHDIACRIDEIVASKPALRRLLEMLFYQEMSQKDVAATLGVSRETIRRHTKELLNLLRSDEELNNLVRN